MPNTIIGAINSMGEKPKECAAANPSCHAELRELRESCTSVDMEANGDYEVGKSVVTSHEFRLKCDAMTEAERAQAEVEIESSLSSLGAVNDSKDLVLLANKNMSDLTPELQLACENCVNDLGNGMEVASLWRSVESQLSSGWGNRNNDLSPDSLSQSLGLGSNFHDLEFSKKLALGRFIKEIINGIKALRGRHSEQWDNKLDNKTWIAKGINGLGRFSKKLGGPGWQYSKLIASDKDDGLVKKIGKSLLGGAGGLVTSTEKLVMAAVDLISPFDFKADPSEKNKIDPEAAWYKKLGARFQKPILWEMVEEIGKSAINSVVDRQGQMARNMHKKIIFKQFLYKFKDVDTYQQVWQKMKMTKQQKGWSGLTHDGTGIIAEYFFMPGAAVNAAGKVSKISSHLKVAQQAKSGMMKDIFEEVAEGTSQSVRLTLGETLDATKAGWKDKEGLRTFKNILNDKTGRGMTNVSKEVLDSYGQFKRSRLALRKLSRGYFDNPNYDEFDWIMNNLFSKRPPKWAEKPLKSFGLASGKVRQYAGSKMGRGADKVRSTYTSRKRKGGNENAPSLPTDSKRPTVNRNNERNASERVREINLGDHRKGIEKRMKKLSAEDQIMWANVLEKTSTLSPRLQGKVFALMAKLPPSIKIGKLTDRGFEMNIGSPPRLAKVDFVVGAMFAGEAGNMLTAGMENLGFDIKVENIVPVQFTGALLRGTWASSAQGVGKAFQRLRGVNFAVFARQIYSEATFAVLGADTLRGLENLQIMAKKGADQIFADLGYLKPNGTLDIGALKAHKYEFRNLVENGARVGTDYETVMGNALEAA